MRRFLFTLATLFAAGGAQAQQLSHEQMREIRQVCEADIRRVCPGIQPGGGRLMACVQSKPEEVSKPCLDALQAAQAARKQ